MYLGLGNNSRTFEAKSTLWEHFFCWKTFSHLSNQLLSGGSSVEIAFWCGQGICQSKAARNISIQNIHIYGAELLVHGTPPPRRGKGHYPLPPLWYCGTSRVSWQASRQQNMFQINSKYTTPAPPCGTVVLLECRGKQVDSRTCSK